MKPSCCELCGRCNVQTTVHHLIPREMGGTHLPTARLCLPCHKQIHALYSNEELAARLNSITLLQHDEQIHNFIKWIRKQPPTKLTKPKKSRNKRTK